MKSLKIPENQIYNAYLIEGEDTAAINKMVDTFVENLLIRDDREQERPIYEERGYHSIEEWQDSVRERIHKNEHPDLIRLRPDRPEENPTTITVGNIRNNLTDTVSVRPYEAEYKIYVIEQAEKMNPQAQNALLKTLEEPPEYVVILLLAANSNAFLETILSRVIEIKAGERDVREMMSELDQEEWVAETSQFLMGACTATTQSILSYIAKVNEWKLPTMKLLSFIEIVLRDVLCYKSVSNEELIYARKHMDMIVRLSGFLTYAKLGELTDCLEIMMKDQAVNVNRDLMLEDFFIRMRRK